MSASRKPPEPCKFAVGQEVTVIYRGQVEGIYRVESIVRKTITLAGYRHITFGLDGWAKLATGRAVLWRASIVAVTDKHREVLHRRSLWSKVDRLLGTNKSSDDRDNLRAAIATETVEKLVELLSPKEPAP